MRNTCVVRGCKYEGRKFFRFPRTIARAKAWRELCGNPCLYQQDVAKLCNHTCICERHFTRAQFTNDNMNRLNLNALPSVFLPLATSVPSTPTEMRSLESDSCLANASMPGADKTVSALNEAVTLNDSEDDCSEDIHNAIPMEKCKSLPEMPQWNTPGILRHSQSLPDVPQSNIRINGSDPSHIVEELSEIYYLITLPYLERDNLNLQWVYRILSGEEGCERIVYESPNKDDKDGFLLIKDSKWDGSNLDKLHLIAIA